MAYLRNYVQNLVNKDSDTTKNVGLGETKTPIGTAAPGGTKAPTTTGSSTAGQILRANPTVNYGTRTQEMVQDIGKTGEESRAKIQDNVDEYGKQINTLKGQYTAPTSYDFSTSAGRDEFQTNLNKGAAAANIPTFTQTASFTPGQLDPVLRSNISGPYTAGMKGLDTAIFGRSNAAPKLQIAGREQKEAFDWAKKAGDTAAASIVTGKQIGRAHV